MTWEEAGGPRLEEALVRRLISVRFPRWRDLPVRAVIPGGNDHRMFRLGDDLSVRLPSDSAYVPQVAKEQFWLPRLAPQLPLRIPEVVAVAEPSDLFPAPWSVCRWLPGVPASTASGQLGAEFGGALAVFLDGLGRVDAAGGPPPGSHSAFRGGPLSHWDAEMRMLVGRVSGRERDVAVGIWRDALTAPGSAAPRWFHGDVAAANLLVDGDGALSAVIDFGCAGVGDPACDTVFRWTCADPRARERFRADYPADEATWARGRGWAVWKGLIMLTATVPGQAGFARDVLDRLFAERRLV